ncbi:MULTISPECIES: DUF4062 domain-containing protein [unclassified Pseudoalteromonas]|uniref:DUF4062 domain-containing protein n=1 Tax=unclassified Pseudoalteromonas TaxID=194690 RepID=UPI00257BB78B|nr:MULTISPECIES: DUF4062 domain-containing protein [unclassified Pseudoalteromonas]|tara:strand:- start:1690 stop:2751 length:1062 start_codon:yes stop_codon:yes gene_type:complete|eukprot:gnl/Dysnectes_brevis/1319_a1481_1450.p1 GENE.gnl/Dysnectes_brevis/1319_a1481_1450~~gnl/Dysnectes_brevis/1319_a1481_1450.p1  ORF type:complete len:354 (-),score=-57.77 gnl/Dysnectes_brevis/1319_a1481_1450:441-1502(-)
MATPKVFVSSTCFDLGEIREQLRRFIQSFGFEAVLSENGDVFYHPELHTHESCIHEISNCQIFILVIGGRFGGEYIADRKKSITNAEYLAARESGIPVFTYVRKGVLSNHHIYQQNKKKEFASDIEYPAIEKQEYALNIFSFIDDVRRSPTNNAFEGFESFSEIENHLRKQWAGMFFDLLKSREVKSQIDATNHLIEGLSSSGKKLENLVKSLYLSSNEPEAQKEIDSIDTYSDVLKFFDRSIRPHWTLKEPYPLDTTKMDVERMAAVPVEDHTWHSYLVALGLFEYDFFPDDADEKEALSFCAGTHSHRTFAQSLENKELQNLFESGIKKSTQEQRLTALKEIDEKYGEIEF